MDEGIPENTALFYAENGYAVWPQAMPSDMLQRLITAVITIQSNATLFPKETQDLLLFERDLPEKHRNGLDSSAVGDAIFIIGDPIKFDPTFQEVLESPILKRAAQTFLESSDLVVHFMNVTIKNPRFGRSIGWHRDYPNAAYCTERSDFIRLMLCMDGMDEHSGATHFVSGSHHISDVAAMAEKNSKWPRPRNSEIKHLTCAPGQMVVIHPKVLHGGGMNTSDRHRRNVVIQIGKASSALTTSDRESATGFRLGKAVLNPKGD